METHHNQGASGGDSESSRGAAPFTHDVEWLRRLDDALDRDQLERRIVEAATHETGVAASRAWIFVSGGKLGTLRLTRVTWRERAGAVAAPSLGANGEAASDEPEVVIELERCGEAVASAWRNRTRVWSETIEEQTPWAGARAVAAAGWRTETDSGGLLVVAWDEPGPEARARFEALAERAERVAGAIGMRERWRIAEDQRDALLEWARAAAGARHVSEAIRAAGEAALRVTRLQCVALWSTEPNGAPKLAFTAGEAKQRERLASKLAAVANQVHESGRSKLIDGESPEVRGVGRALLVPVAAFGHALGVLATYDVEKGTAGHGSEIFPDSLLSLEAIAGGLAVLLDRAEGAELQRTLEQQVREVRARLKRIERMAAVGENASARMEAFGQPLASVGAFARRAHRELDESDPRREYLEVILRESERLERMLSESRTPLAPEPPNFKLESLNHVIQDVLPGVGEKLVRRRVRLLKRLDPEAPKLLLDATRIRQAFKNVIERAVDSVPLGGRVRLESRLVRDHVIAEIAFDGLHSPGDLLEELFVPFAASAEGGDPGFGVADRIVREHGGEIRVRSDGESGAVVLITFPVRGNEERRGAGERRVTRSDRRRGEAKG